MTGGGRRDAESGPERRARAPAKVNPFLAVLGRRADGYHEIDTLMLAVELEDEIAARATRAPGIAFSLAGPAASPDVPAGAENLAVRAAQGVLALALEAGRAGPWRGLALALEKRVPSQAGLGGGSSDAAAAALAARAALGVPGGPPAVPDRELLVLLAGLGSDCAFFLAAAETGFARCRGRGEIVEPLPAPPEGWWVALVAPDLACPTSAIYRALEIPLSPTSAVPSLPPALFDSGEGEARVLLSNRLESAAFLALPTLHLWRELLDRCGAPHFRLCGSGSAFFGLYRDPLAARRDLHALELAARDRGLACRGAWLTRPARRGAVLLPATAPA